MTLPPLGAGPSEKKTSVFTLVYDLGFGAARPKTEVVFSGFFSIFKTDLLDLGFENFFLKKNVTSDQSEEDS